MVTESSSHHSPPFTRFVAIPYRSCFPLIGGAIKSRVHSVRMSVPGIKPCFFNQSFTILCGRINSGIQNSLVCPFITFCRSPWLRASTLRAFGNILRKSVHKSRHRIAFLKLTKIPERTKFPDTIRKLQIASVQSVRSLRSFAITKNHPGRPLLHALGGLTVGFYRSVGR